MKKIISYIGILVLSMFSFYYTDKALEIVKSNDPIMKSILANKDKFLVNPVSASIDNDEIVPGINGMEINVDSSYREMKKYNSYNEDKYVFKELSPLLSFTNQYDKYIVGGNEIKNQLALVFKIVDISYMEDINNILIDKNVSGTFFIDGAVVENNISYILKLLDNNEIENLGYNLEYSNDKIIYTNNMIESITRKSPKYCYTDYKNDNIINLCSKNNMYTIKPSISVLNYPFSTVKNNAKSGNIISFNVNSEVIKELPSIISYLCQKGYKLVTLDELISEKFEIEK